MADTKGTWKLPKASSKDLDKGEVSNGASEIASQAFNLGAQRQGMLIANQLRTTCPHSPKMFPQIRKDCGICIVEMIAELSE